jgi:calcium-translocating P-type ATPase
MKNTGVRDGAAILKGLTAKQVAESRKEHGSNVFIRRKRKGFWAKLIENFGDPMNKILLIALGINLIFMFRTADWFETLGIGLTVCIAAFISTVSEIGSEAAFEKLRDGAANALCKVRRNGKLTEVQASELVTGDIVLLNAGDRVPADGILLEGALDVDQSALNGESKEAKKYPCAGSTDIGKSALNGGERAAVVRGRVSESAGRFRGEVYGADTGYSALDGGANERGERPKGADGTDTGEALLSPCALFGGSAVMNGGGVMQISAVGGNTFYGKIAAELQEDAPNSPLKTRLEALAKKISIFGYAGAGLVMLSFLFYEIFIANGFDAALIKSAVTSPAFMFLKLSEAFTLAVTVIVMAVPEGLPMMITIVLASNMRRMQKDNVLVRKLNGIETAGSMNIMFTDKTGTLTTGKLKLSHVIFGDGETVAGADATKNYDARTKLFTEAVYFNNGAEMKGQSAVSGNATDRALLEFAHGKCRADGIKKVKVFPFNSGYKFMATTLNDGRTLVKGAPEALLPHVRGYVRADGSVEDGFNAADLTARIAELNRQAVRVIAVALSDGDVESAEDLRSLVFVAFAGLKDGVRKEAVKGVKDVKSAGIQVVMITGDAKDTAYAVAKEAGIINGGVSDVVLTSEELGRLDDAELKDVMPRLKIVARAVPSDKSRLVKTAQSMGLVTGMTGDGINDAPALKKADIGFAVGSGTEVAKEAADVVLLDDNFMSVSKAVLYGRNIFKCIRKFLIFQLSIDFSAVIISVLGPLVGINSPITIMQMLWINLVMDTLAGLAFSGEIPRQSYMKEKPKNRGESLINRYMWSQICVTAAFISVMSLWFLKSPRINALFLGFEEEYMLTAFFSLFIFTAVFNSLNARTHEKNLFGYILANKQFIVIMCSVAVIQLILIYFAGTLFNTVPLKFSHLAMISGLASVVLVVELMRKLVVRRIRSIKSEV